MNAQSGRSKGPESAVAFIARGTGVGDDANALVRPEDTAAAYVARLIDEGFAADAVRVLGSLLPPREAVWWAWTCAKKAAGEAAPPETMEAFAAVEKWLRDPTDANRRAAMEAGEAADFATPAGCVAMATFFSGGSIAPPNIDPVPAPPFVAGKALSGAILIAAALGGEPEGTPERLKSYLDQGIHVARRVGVWPA